MLSNLKPVSYEAALLIIYLGVIIVLTFIYNNFSNIIILLFIIFIVYEWASYLIKKEYKTCRNYRDYILNTRDLENIKQQIEYMDGREFEIFCAWLLKKTGKYQSIELTPATNDEGKDIILNNSIFVECKRYTENAIVTEEFMIGREICQKLVGAIVAEGYKDGIIITTGNIHPNAWNYILKLEKKSEIKIDIITLDEIINMIEKYVKTEEIFDKVGIMQD